jgi:hypothetical protein
LLQFDPAADLQKGALARVEHGNLWGFEGLTLESPRLPPHIGTAARKHGWQGDGGVALSKPLGE